MSSRGSTRIGRSAGRLESAWQIVALAAAGRIRVTQPISRRYRLD